MVQIVVLKSDISFHSSSQSKCKRVFKSPLERTVSRRSEESPAMFPFGKIVRRLPKKKQKTKQKKKKKKKKNKQGPKWLGLEELGLGNRQRTLKLGEPLHQQQLWFGLSFLLKVSIKEREERKRKGERPEARFVKAHAASVCMK